MARKDLEKLGRVDTVNDEREKSTWLHILSEQRI
jgi:hypothetical protein